MTTPSSRKRTLSPVRDPSPKRVCEEQESSSNQHLLTELTGVLAEIRSTPSSGEISAELLETLKLLMLQIEHLSSDASNLEAVQMKHETDLCLESWFDELVARCEADGELDLDRLEEELAAASSDEDDDDDDNVALSLALALQDEQDHDQQEDETVIVDDSEESQTEAQSPVPVVV